VKTPGTSGESRYAFVEVGLRRVIAGADAENVASVRVI